MLVRNIPSQSELLSLQWGWATSFVSALAWLAAVPVMHIIDIMTLSPWSEESKRIQTAIVSLTHVSPPWWVWVLVMAASAVYWWKAWNKRSYYCQEVLEGRVVDDSYYSSSNGTFYELCIEGENRVGHTVRQWRSVSPKTYGKYDYGDKISFQSRSSPVEAHLPRG